MSRDVYLAVVGRRRRPGGAHALGEEIGQLIAEAGAVLIAAASAV